MQRIIERQNETQMLEIQFSARFFYNLAEKTNKSASFLALIPLLALIPHHESWNFLISTILVVVDLCIVIATLLTRYYVKNAADLRAYFDDYVFATVGHDTNYKLDKKLKSCVFRLLQKHRKQAQIAISNTGIDTPPGVKNWYGITHSNSHNEAIVKCQEENCWWDKKLNIYRIISPAVFLTFVIVTVSILLFVFEVNWYMVLLTLLQLVLRLVDRLDANIKYYISTLKLEGACQLLKKSKTISNIKEVQKFINERRHIPVLGNNWWHRRLAKKLSNEHNFITE